MRAGSRDAPTGSARRADSTVVGFYDVDLDEDNGLVRLTLTGTVSEEEMRRGFAKLRRAIARLGGADFRVIADDRDLRPLTPGAALVQAEAKTYAASARGYRGSAVLVKDPITMMQARRTSKAARGHQGILTTDTGEVEKFVAKVPKRGQ
jgi:hypothetical protein